MDSCRLYHLLLWSRQTWHLPIHTLLFLSSLPASDSHKLAHCMADSSCKVQWWWPPCQPWTLVRVLRCIKMGLPTGGQLTLAPLLPPLWWGCIFTTAPRTLLSAACSVSHLDTMWLRKFVLMPPRHAVFLHYTISFLVFFERLISYGFHQIMSFTWMRHHLKICFLELDTISLAGTAVAHPGPIDMGSPRAQKAL